MLSEEYREAVLSFGYANDSRNAFRAAYQGAEKTDDMELYALAGAFASIYITETEDGIYDEAVEALMYSSEECSDVSGCEYIIQKNMFAEVRNLLSDALLYLAEKNSIQLGDSADLNQCINELKSTFSFHQILDEILKSIPDDSDTKEERQEEKTEKPKQDII